MYATPALKNKCYVSAVRLQPHGVGRLLVRLKYQEFVDILFTLEDSSGKGNNEILYGFEKPPEQIFPR